MSRRTANKSIVSNPTIPGRTRSQNASPIPEYISSPLSQYRASNSVSSQFVSVETQGVFDNVDQFISSNWTKDSIKEYISLRDKLNDQLKADLLGNRIRDMIKKIDEYKDKMNPEVYPIPSRSQTTGPSGQSSTQHSPRAQLLPPSRPSSSMNVRPQVPGINLLSTRAENFLDLEGENYLLKKLEEVQKIHRK